MYYLELRTKKMVEKLELRHLAPYLPYGLKVIGNISKSIYTIDLLGDMVILNSSIRGTSGHMWPIYFDDFKPLLIPLSEIESKKYIDIFFQKDSFLDEITSSDNQFESAFNFVNRFKITDNDYCYPYDFFSKLFEHHFDVFGLIDAGLALNKLNYEVKA